MFVQAEGRSPLDELREVESPPQSLKFAGTRTSSFYQVGCSSECHHCVFLHNGAGAVREPRRFDSKRTRLGSFGQVMCSLAA